MDTGKWSFGKIINTYKTLQNMAFAMPKEVINKLLEDSVKKKDYTNLEVLAIFADKENVNNAAKQIILNGDYKTIITLAYSSNIDAHTLGKIGQQLVEKSSIMY